MDETETIILAYQDAGAPTSRGRHAASFPATALQDEDIFTSVCFFFSNYVIENRGMQSTRSELRYLPQIYAQASPQSTIFAAVTALTLSFLSMWRGQAPDSAQSQYYTSRAVLRLRKDLGHSERCRADETLLAVMMLQFRDTIIGSKKIKPGKNVHQQGAYALVRQKQTENCQSPLAHALISSLRNSTVYEALRKRQRVDISLDIWRVTPEELEDPNDGLSWIGIEVSSLQADLEEHRHKYAAKLASSNPMPNEKDMEEVEKLRCAALNAEQALMNWSDTRSSDWRPENLPEAVVPLSVRQAGIYQGLCQVYPSVSIAGIWHTYRIQRIILLRIIISCEKWSRGWRQLLMPVSELPKSADYIRCVRSVQQLVDELCAAVPFHVGNRQDAGDIHEFGDIEKLEFAFDSIADPWRKHALREGHVSYAEQSRLSVSERKHEALALGGWHLLGVFGMILKMADEPIDDPLSSGAAEKFGALLREGQVAWMLGQLRRILILQKMIRKDSTYLKRPQQ